MKKNTNSKKTTKSRAKKPSGRKIVNGAGRDVKHELISLCILALTILLFVSFMDLAGTVGGLLKTICYGMFGGITAWALAGLLCYVSLFPFGRAATDKIKRAISVCFLGISCAALIAAFSLEKGSMGFGEYISACINNEVLFSGGVVGGFFSYLFKLLFSEVGAMIIIFACIAASLILISKHSVGEMISAVAELFQKEPDLSMQKERKEKHGKPVISAIKESPVFRRDKRDQEQRERKDAEIKFRGFKDSAPQCEEDGVPWKEPERTGAAEKTIPGNISFHMKGAEIPSEKKRDPLADTVKDLSGEAPPVGSFRDSAKEKIARNKGGASSDGAVQDGSIQMSEADLSHFDYVFPSYDLLNDNTAAGVDVRSAKKEAETDAYRLESTLKSFGVEARVVNVSRGPTVTRYELQPNAGVKISKIVSLSDDIAMGLAAKSIRIEAPIPGKGAVGIEIPNKETQPVYLKDVITTGEFDKAKSKLTVCLGKDISGDTVLADISKMPHTLIAGATGSGKSVCINTLIISLLYKARPQELKMIMIDPKVVELGVYNGIPHLEMPVVTDPRKAAGALQWAVREMEKRYQLFAQEGVRDLSGYNEVISKQDPLMVMPHYVIIVDELADLMMVAPGEIEDNICRLAQMARAAGMHLIIATQRPSVDVITGVIKANVPSRIAFKVASQFDSRTILDGGGAEKLLGRGDMMFLPMGASEATRIQGAFISDHEVERIISFIKQQGEFSYNEAAIQEIEDASKNIGNGKKKGGYSAGGDSEEQGSSKDKILEDAIELVVEVGTASASFLQRKFGIGYSRAARIIDQMEEMGIVSGNDGSKPRQVLMSKNQFYEMKAHTDAEAAEKQA